MAILNFHNPTKKLLLLWMRGSVVNVKGVGLRAFFAKFTALESDTHFRLACVAGGIRERASGGGAAIFPCGRSPVEISRAAKP